MGFLHLPCGSPQWDKPHNNSTITLRRDGPGRQERSPSLKAQVLFILCSDKRNSLEHNFYDLCRIFGIPLREDLTRIIRISLHWHQ